MSEILIKIGTRPSKLALWQAHHVKDRLESEEGVKVELVKVTTKGDRILDRSLVEIGGKGLFLKEIEDKLIEGEIDLAVHSLKDVPYEMPEGLELCTILERADPYDAFLSEKYSNPEDLPEGAVVGTSSLRRSVQLQERFPKIIFKPLRGNVDTRIQKLKDGDFDAIILACAGLKRLGFDSEIKSTLNIIPAVGQGAIGIEVRADDLRLRDLLAKKLHHEETAQCVQLERLYSKGLEGSCQTPMGCHVTLEDDSYHISYFLADDDGANPCDGELSCDLESGESAISSLVSRLRPSLK